MKSASKHSVRYGEARVFLVGAGPGDPGLLTVKGLECLRRAEVIIYDHLADPRLLAHARGDTERVYVGKQAGRHTLKQSDINALIVEKGRTGKVVVRLKGGDPFVFGRGGEEAGELRKAGIPYEIVPGVTSGIAAPAYAGIPVTHRGVACSVALITGHEDPEKPDSQIAWEYLAKGVDTLVFYMGVENLPLITSQLTKNGRSPRTPVGIIRRGTKPGQQTVTGTLGTIVDIAAGEGIKPPSIIIVGDVVELREQLAWVEDKPLWGKRVINTRSRAQASALSVRLSQLGAEVIDLPTIEVVAEGAGSQLEHEVDRAAEFDWIIFTSPNGVEAFFDLLLQRTGDVRSIGNARIACIGPGTAKAVNAYHVSDALTAGKAVAEGLIEDLEKQGPWEDVKVLIPRAEQARDLLPDTLREWGADLTVVTAYRTVRPSKADKELLDSIVTGDYDIITFSSSSTFINLVALLGEERFRKARGTLRGASIGPVTSATMREQGVDPLTEAIECTIPGLVRAIEEILAQ